MFPVLLHCPLVAPDATCVIFITTEYHVTHCAHPPPVGHTVLQSLPKQIVTPVIIAPLILVALTILAFIFVPLIFVPFIVPPFIVTPLKVIASTVPIKWPFPFEPSKEIPVVVLLLPSDVRNIFQIYCIVLGAMGTILKPLAINNIQDIQRKNKVAHLMKLIPFLFDCKFLLVKLILTIEVVKCCGGEVHSFLYFIFGLWA